MNTSASIGPVQFVGLAYLICIVVSLGVAGIIKLLFGLIKLQQNRIPINVTVEGKRPVKTGSLS